MTKSPCSTSLPESAGSPSDLKQPDLFGPLPSASKTSSAKPYSESTGPTRQSSTTLDNSEARNPHSQMELISSAAGSRSRANLGPKPGSKEARKMTATSGRKWLGLLKSYNLNILLARTCADLLTSQWGSSAAFLTWKASATAPSHLLLELAVSMPRTAAPAFGSSPRKMTPTPTASDHIERQSTSTEKMNPLTGKSVSLDRFVRFWPDSETQASGVPRLLHTPTATANQMAPSMKNRDPGSWWATPRASDIRDGRTLNEKGQRVSKSSSLVFGANLADQVKLWPTPQHRDFRTGEAHRFTDPKRSQNLNDAVALWPTPKAQEPDNPCSWTAKYEGSAALNPAFVEWLMGFPAGWTSLTAEELQAVLKTECRGSNHSETRSSRKSSRKSGGPSSQRRTRDEC